MNVQQLITIINGTLINPTADLSREIKGGCGADLMSDLLASIQPEAVLLTGLCNPQVVRTAQMADVAAIVLVGAMPEPNFIVKANQEGITLLSTAQPSFYVVGKLWEWGVRIA